MKTKITILFFLVICSLNLFSTNYTVTNNTDDATTNSGSLRDVLTRANLDNSTPHTITFSGSYTITLGSALPTPGKAMTIDGGANTITILGTSVSGNSLTVAVNATLKKLTFDRALVSFGNYTCEADYCTFKNGNAGAVKVTGAFTANNCTFDSNSTTATTLGSAIYGNSSTNVITLNDCVVSNNTSSIGPAIYAYGGAATVALTLNNCIVKNNTNTSTTVYGGGISTYGIVSITNSQISGNTCSHRGAGIALLLGNSATYKSKLTMSNSTVSGNTASLYDGGICIQGGSTPLTDAVTFTNCTISGNSSLANGGGGIGIGVGASGTWAYNVVVNNCTITGNTTAGNVLASIGGGICKNGGTGSLKVNYSIVAGNNSNSTAPGKDMPYVAGYLTSDTGRNLYGGSASWGTSTITGNVNLTSSISTILNTTLTDNGGTTALPDGTYVKTHALNAGTSTQTAIDPDATGVSGMPSTDQRGTGRDALPDMGAYESMLPGVPTAVTVTSNNVSGQLSVAFTAPGVSTKGGASISNYKYSTDGGTSFTALSTPQITSPFVISGLTNGTPYNVQIRAVNSNGDGVPCASKTATPSVPTVSGAATATAFTTTYGTSSASQSFSISGANLVGAITATAPTGFEVSSDGTTYAATATYSRSLIDFTASGTVYIRLKATASVSGTYNSQNIVVSSPGATSVNITTSASGNAVSAKALTITADNVNKTYGTLLSGAAGSIAFTSSGLANGESIGSVTIAYGTGSAANASVGTYSATAVVPSAATGGTFTAGNYAITYTAGNIIVGAKALTITADNQTVAYGTASATVTGAGSYTPSGFVNSETASVIGGTISYSTIYTNTTAAGTPGVTITPIVSGLTATNYSFTAVAGTVSITKATPSISVSGTQSFTYNGSAQGPATVSYNGDGTPSLLYTSTDAHGYSSATAPSNAGTYQVVYSATAGTNYNAASTSAYTFTIYSTGNISSDTNVSSLTLSAASNLSVATGNTLTIDAATTVNSVTVAPGAKLTLNVGKSLNTGSITLQSDASGTATLTDGNSNGGLTVSGTSTVQQYLSGARNWYVSSPVAGSAVPASGYTFYSRNEPAANWTTMTSDSILKSGRGYIANLLSGTATYNFTGIINSGDKNVSLFYSNGVTKAGFNLIGNPYPSHYAITKSQTDAANALNTIWYRTADWVEVSQNPSVWKYVYTFQTCLMQPNGSIIGTPDGTSNIIAPMQAFWIRTSVNGSTFSFANANRSHQASNLFKSAAKKDQNQPMIRLQASNGMVSDEAVLYSNADAANGLDAYDAIKMNNNSASVPEIYTILDNQQIAINGMNSIPYDTEIPLGFTSAAAGTFSIKASQITNFAQGMQLILKDYQDSNNPVIKDLSDGSSYSFSSEITSNNISRFALLFRAPSAITGLSQTDNSLAWLSINGGRISINGNIAPDARVDIFNALGQKIQSAGLTATTRQLDTGLSAGIYLISLTNGGKTIIKKIIIDCEF